MKGNHNFSNKPAEIKEIVFNKSKIQNERKSQLTKCLSIFQQNCVQQVKDTK